jgi:hypothetical protein
MADIFARSMFVNNSNNLNMKISSVNIKHGESNANKDLGYRPSPLGVPAGSWVISGGTAFVVLEEHEKVHEVPFRGL